MRQIMADLNAIAEAVKNEIARQQASVNYEDLSQDELERVVKQLQDRLACAQGLLSKRGGEPKSAPRGDAKAPNPWTRPDGTQDAEKIIAYMTEQMSNRIMVLDGAMGTAIQQYKFTEEDFRMEMFKDHPGEIKGNNDLLCFTQVGLCSRNRPRFRPPS